VGRVVSSTGKSQRRGKRGFFEEALRESRFVMDRTDGEGGRGCVRGAIHQVRLHGRAG